MFFLLFYSLAFSLTCLISERELKFATDVSELISELEARRDQSLTDREHHQKSTKMMQYAHFIQQRFTNQKIGFYDPYLENPFLDKYLEFELLFEIFKDYRLLKGYKPLKYQNHFNHFTEHTKRPVFTYLETVLSQETISHLKIISRSATFHYYLTQGIQLNGVDITKLLQKCLDLTIITLGAEDWPNCLITMFKRCITASTFAHLTQSKFTQKIELTDIYRCKLSDKTFLNLDANPDYQKFDLLASHFIPGPYYVLDDVTRLSLISISEIVILKVDIQKDELQPDQKYIIQGKTYHSIGWVEVHPNEVVRSFYLTYGDNGNVNVIPMTKGTPGSSTEQNFTKYLYLEQTDFVKVDYLAILQQEQLQVDRTDNQTQQDGHQKPQTESSHRS